MKSNHPHGPDVERWKHNQALEAKVTEMDKAEALPRPWPASRYRVGY